MKRLFVVLFALAAGYVSAQSPEAVILEMSGTVELKAGGATDWVVAKEGDRIAKDTVVSTGFKSTAILAVGSSTIVVRPLTRLSLAELVNREETETININLNAGRIRTDVKPPAGSKASVTVQTPMAVASVRGTRFDMNAAKIQVDEGTVFYLPENGTLYRPVIVNAGREAWIDAPTDRAVQPTAAAEVVRRLPLLPGRKALPRTDNSARGKAPDVNGSFTVDIVF
jgi:hypothetical protein